jgi:uncharacterized coiled-coil DUF342 family protein
MPKKTDHPPELDALGRKVREARRLIDHLRKSNRALADELAEIKHRGSKDPSGRIAGKAPAPETDAGADELALLRQERKDIRERIAHLLECLEEVSGPPEAD